MKTLLYTVLLSMLCLSVIGQKVEIKDSDENVLVQINDEGTRGSIYIPSGPIAPLATKNKLYNTNAQLYWDGIRIGTILEAGGWTLDGANLYPTSSSTKVGVGTTTPLFNLQIEGSTTGDVSLGIHNRNSAGSERLYFGESTSSDAGILVFGSTSASAGKYRFLNNKTDGHFDWVSDAQVRMTLDNEGKLGIGTASPVHMLDVSGAIRVGNTTTGHAGTIRYNAGDNTFEGHDGSAWSKFGGHWVPSGSDLYYNNGAVGIGTTSPASLLHVEENTTDPVTLTIHNTDDTGSERLFFGTSVGSDAFIWAYGSSASSNAGKVRFLNNRTGANFDWVVDGGVKMKLANDGNLGVGVSSPTAKTHIVQDLSGVDAFRVDDAVSDPSPFLIKSNGAIGVGTTLPMAKMHIIEESVNDAFRVDDAASDATPFVVKDNGDVGIGISSPVTKLHVDGYVTLDEKLVAGDDNGLKFCTNEQTTRMVIDDDGRVGIGTLSPLYNFEVNDGTSVFSRTAEITAEVGVAAIAENGNSVSASLARRTFGVLSGEIVYQNYGVYAVADESGVLRNYGLFARASGATDANWAGYFEGDVHVTGALSKGSGTFKIDHPLDPENQYLSHSFVESPDMMNVYNGNVTTDASGRAEVLLPEYFEALNKDFRYQLTVIGEFAQAIISKKISGNKFQIRTDKPNIEVSWQVTGIRQDAYANKNRVQVEEDKAAADKGTYLHPEAFGKPIEMQEGYEQIHN